MTHVTERGPTDPYLRSLPDWIDEGDPEFNIEEEAEDSEEFLAPEWD